MPEDSSYPLDLLRSELKTAMAEQMLALIERFASKAEVLNVQRMFEAHEKEVAGRFELLLERIDERMLVEDRVRQIADEEITSHQKTTWGLRSSRAGVYGVALGMCFGVFSLTINTLSATGIL